MEPIIRVLSLLSLFIVSVSTTLYEFPTSSESSSVTHNTKSLTSGHKCHTTCTERVTITSSVTVLTTTQVIASDADLINGDDYPQRTGVLTLSYTTITTSFVANATTTVTTTTTPTSKRGTDVYYTIPTTEGFLPIKSTLPSATYVDDAAKIRKREKASKATRKICKTFHKTITSVSTATVTSTATNTLTGTVIVFPGESTAYELSSYTFQTSYILYSATTTVFTTATSVATATANTTLVVNATTATVHAACATENFASDIVLSNGTVQPIVNVNWDIVLQSTDSAAACCEAALAAYAVIWTWAYGSICTAVRTTNGDCVQGENTQRAVYGGSSGASLVVGNGYCGELNGAVQRS